MKGYYGYVALLILLSVCNAKRSNAQYRTATVVGRFIIKNPVHGHYKKNKRLHFSERFAKKYTHLIKTKDSGYFSMRLPLGYSYLEQVTYFDGGEFLKKFPTDYLEIKLDSADRVYYIGDLVLTWDIKVTEERPENTGVGGGLVGYALGRAIQKNQEGKIPGEALPVSVTLNPETVSYFCEKMNIKEGLFLTAAVSIEKR